MVDFNPRSPDGERHSPLGVATTIAKISIHAPRMGSDVSKSFAPPNVSRISIHAPRMGSDINHAIPQHATIDFNPRSPDGERRYHRHAVRRVRQISIHAPRMGSDRRNYARHGCGLDFNPRSPDGERLRYRCGMLKRSLFQSTLPGWGATS